MTSLAVKPARQLTLGFDTLSQHNLLVRHPMRMGLYEARIFALMLRSVHKNMEVLPGIKVPVKDVVGCDKPNKKMYHLIEEACKALFNKELNLLDPKVKKNSSFSKVRIVQDLTHMEGTGFIIGSFADKIRDYLLDLTENFTVGEIGQLMQLRNANSHRFYWVLKSWDDRPDKTFSIDEFREIILGEDHKKYANYGQFKRAILLPVMEELSKVGFNVLHEEKKNGKTVTGLKFFFPKKKTKALEPHAPTPPSSSSSAPDVKVVNLDPDYQKVRSLMIGGVLALTEKQADKILNHVYDEHHQDRFKRVLNFMYHLKINMNSNKGTIHSPGAFAYNKFETEYGMSGPKG